MPAVNASFFRISATRNAFRKVRSTVLLLDDLTQVPPAASIFSRALSENAWAWTVRAFVSSPCPAP